MDTMRQICVSLHTSQDCMQLETSLQVFSASVHSQTEYTIDIATIVTGVDIFKTVKSHWDRSDWLMSHYIRS